MTNHPNRSKLAKALITYLQEQYEAAYCDQWDTKMVGKTIHPDTLKHAEHYGYDPMQPQPGEHYSAGSHVEAIAVGNMTVGRAVARAQEAGASHASMAARDQLSGSLPPSEREKLGILEA